MKGRVKAKDAHCCISYLIFFFQKKNVLNIKKKKVLFSFPVEIVLLNRGRKIYYKILVV